KAWAADRSAARLAAALGCGVLVGLGGEISVAGEPPAGGWRVRVQDVTGRPEDPPVGPASVVAIQAAGWPRRARAPGAGGAAVRCCTTSSTRAPGCPPRSTGARCRWPPLPAWTRKR